VATSNLSEGAGPGRPSISFDDLREMLKVLLIDRFEMKVRMEDQAVDAYELVAEKRSSHRPIPRAGRITTLARGRTEKIRARPVPFSTCC
jgi:uncharacterized protein (TIGR03435 family)